MSTCFVYCIEGIVTWLAILDLDQNRTGYSWIGSEQEGCSITGSERNTEERLVRRLYWWWFVELNLSRKGTACSNEIGSLTSLMHVTSVHPVTTVNQFHCTRLYAVRSNNNKKKQVFQVACFDHTILLNLKNLSGKQSRIYESMVQEIANSNWPDNLLRKTEVFK